MLDEKKVKYKSVIVDIMKGEQYEDSYMKLNPKGSVPTLVHKGKIIPGSLAIIRYLDIAFSPGSLSPQDEEARKAMDEWLQLADSLPMETIIYGKRIQAGGPAGKIADNLHSSRTALLAKKVETAPQELKEVFQKKLDYVREVDDKVHNAVLVERLLTEHIEKGAMDKLETALQANAFLTGSNYTLADAFWTMILGRLSDLGLGARFWANGKRPRVEAYYHKLVQRPSYNTGVVALIPPAPRPKKSTFSSIFWVSTVVAVAVLAAAVSFTLFSPGSKGSGLLGKIF